MSTQAAGFVVAALCAVAASGQEADRVFHLTHVETAQQLQEIATVIRSVADIRQLSADMEQKSVAVRGTASQIAMAEWLVSKLDGTAGTQSGGTHEYRAPGSSDDVMRVFYVDHAETVQDLQEIVTLVRAIGDVQRLFVYNARKAMALRGAAAQIAVSEWLVNELNQAAGSESAGTHEYRMPGGGDEVVRVFYLAHAERPQQRQEIATRIRLLTNVKRFFVYSPRRALALRGTPDQMAAAERLLQ